MTNDFKEPRRGDIIDENNVTPSGFFTFLNCATIISPLRGWRNIYNFSNFNLKVKVQKKCVSIFSDTFNSDIINF